MMRRLLIATALAAVAAAAPAAASTTSNIDSANRFAWGENIGWINMRGQGTGPVDAPPPVFWATFASGFAWGENVGWINLGDGSPANGVSYSNTSANDFGVNVDSSNPANILLSGFAWGENIGWINFDGSSTGGPTARVSVNAAGQFSGFAWGENVGWINFDGSSTGGPTARVTAVAPTASQIASGLVGTTPIPLLSDRQPDNVVNAADVVSRVQAGAP